MDLELEKVLNTPIAVIGIVITIMIVVGLFPMLNDSLTQLANVQTNNTLIQAVKPVLPYITGVILLFLIILPVTYGVKQLKEKL